MIKNKIFLLLIVLFFGQISAQCWKSFSGGALHSVAVLKDGSLWNWGQNPEPPLLDGTTTKNLIPTKVGNDRTWRTVSANHTNHTLAIKNDGTLWGWGFNSEGQAGDKIIGNSGSDSYIPNPTQIGTASDWKIITNAGEHSLAIKNDGTLWGWGNNVDGQLGTGNTNNTNQPTKIGADNDWANVSAGNLHTIAIKNNGTIWTWGNNTVGQLGMGNSFNYRYDPTQVDASTDWTDVFAGGYFCIAKKSDGTLWSFGNSSFGELGHGDLFRKLYPTQIGTANDWKTVSLGEYFTLAIKTDGSLWSWGMNINGMLGTGGFTNRNFPLQVGNQKDWDSISGGGFHSMASKTNGDFYMWGNNYGGQLGNGMSGNNRDITAPTFLKCPNLFGGDSTRIFYPNPADQVIFVNSDFIFEQAVNMEGRLVYLTNIDDQMNISNLVTGAYILTFKDKNGKSVSATLLKR